MVILVHQAISVPSRLMKARSHFDALRDDHALGDQVTTVPIVDHVLIAGDAGNRHYIIVGNHDGIVLEHTRREIYVHFEANGRKNAAMGRPSMNDLEGTMVPFLRTLSVTGGCLILFPRPYDIESVISGGIFPHMLGRSAFCVITYVERLFPAPTP